MLPARAFSASAYPKCKHALRAEGGQESPYLSATLTTTKFTPKETDMMTLLHCTQLPGPSVHRGLTLSYMQYVPARRSRLNLKA